jgi:hypothetical protein
MGAAPKHRRSASKRNSTRGSNRYDSTLTRAKTVKRNGGKFLAKSKVTGKFAPAHRVSAENPEYKGFKLKVKSKK